jgi:hypothetical protein
MISVVKTVKREGTVYFLLDINHFTNEIGTKYATSL